MGKTNVFLLSALPEFLLYAARTYIKRITLGDHRETTIPLGSGLRNAIALDFDYAHDCIYWADITLDTIKRSYLNGSGRYQKATCKQTQQLPTWLGQLCWKLLRPCWQWCANGCNNSQRFWPLKCIVGRIQPRRLWRPCVMRVLDPNNVGRAVQTNPTSLRYASAITAQKKYWELLG